MKAGASGNYITIILGILALIGISLTRLYNYVLFHTLAEAFIIVIACGVFMVAWNSRHFSKSSYFTFIGIAYLFVALIELLHTMAYKGMGIFQGYDANLPTQLWIAARYMESLSLLVAPLLINRKLRIWPTFLSYTVVTALLVVSIFYWKNFPACFVEGSGLTSFKVASEYIISIILAGAIYLLLQNRKQFDPRVLKLLIASIAVTIGAEMAFTLYTDVYGALNLVGHLLTIVSFYLIYRAVIVTGLKEPYALLFHDLNTSRDELQLEKNRLQSYFDVAGVMLVVISPDERIQLINKKGCEILGGCQEDITGKNWFDTFLPERARDEIRIVFRSLVAGEIAPYEYVENAILTQNGEERIIAWHNTVLRNKEGKIVATLGSGEDITERKSMQNVVNLRLKLWEFSITHSTEELLQETLDEVGNLTNSPIGFYHFVEADQKTLSLQAWSTRTVQEFCRAQGKGMHYSVDEAGVWVDCVHQRRPVIHNDYASLPHRKGMPEGHAQVVRELVVPIMRHDRIVAILGVGNKPSDYTEKDAEIANYLADIAWTIVEHKKIEEALRASEDKYRDLVENLNDVIYTLDTQGNITYMSPALERISQYRASELIGQNFSRFIHPDDLPELITSFQGVLAGQLQPSEYRLIDKDGSIRWVRSSSRPQIEDGKVIGVTGILTDITERKVMLQHIVLTDRLAALGDMAGGFAHELNNPLSGVIGYAQLLQDRKDLPADVREDIELIYKDGQRAANVIK
ncbi:MAG: PAS domain S-box protein, partial [Chloroflexi bacterium]|nr:PAS domain S-box protein [Chloroflexota bacterium]